MKVAIDMEKLNEVEMRAGYLRAMLNMTCGEGGEAFRRMNHDLQDYYCAAMAQFADELCEALAPEENVKKAA